jgi:hypothetical protein
MYEAVTPDDIKVIVGALVNLAKGGNMKAAQLVLNYVGLKPVQLVDFGTDQSNPVSIVLMPKTEEKRP